MNVNNILENKNDLLKSTRVGEIVEGRIVGLGKSAVYIDLDIRGTGIIYGREFYESKDALRDLRMGDKIFAKIVELENEDGYVELSLNQAGKELTWESLRQKKEDDETIKVKISGANKGGLLAEVSGIPAFLPVSQLSAEHYPRVEGGDSVKILRELQNFMGKEIEVKIFDLNPSEAKLILSEKAKDSAKIKEILKNYQVGDLVEGEITGVVDFGAFMKFGEENLEGLVHISELDWQLIDNPSEIIKVGQKVKAKIINTANGKVSLSMKALQKDPWEGIEEKYKKGDIIEGMVVKFNPFGAFVKILSDDKKVPSKIQGLCHISEFGTRTKMEEDLKIGENYQFQVIQISPAEHKMTLGLVKKNEPLLT